MGEAGPEAILPLTRRNGVLGVQGGGSNTYVSVVNNSDKEASVNERKDASGNKFIEVTIGQVVKSQMASGNYDRVMSSSFGIKRKGYA